MLEVNGGGKHKIEITRRHWKQTMATLAVTVVDEAGKPLEARISGAASDGKLYAPPDSYVFNARLATGLKRIFYTRGAYRVEAPPGKLALEATKGFEYGRRAGGLKENARAAIMPVNIAGRHGWSNGSTHVIRNGRGTTTTRRVAHRSGGSALKA